MVMCIHSAPPSPFVRLYSLSHVTGIRFLNICFLNSLCLVMAVAVPLFLGRLACWALDISVMVVAILMLRVFAALRAGLWTAVAAGGLGYVFLSLCV
jgi:hypothetical protein